MDFGLWQEIFTYLNNSVDFSMTDRVRNNYYERKCKKRVFNVYYSKSECLLAHRFLSFVDGQWKRGSKSGVFLQAKRHFQQPYNAGG